MNGSSRPEKICSWSSIKLEGYVSCQVWKWGPAQQENGERLVTAISNWSVWKYGLRIMGLMLVLQLGCIAHFPLALWQQRCASFSRDEKFLLKSLYNLAADHPRDLGRRVGGHLSKEGRLWVAKTKGTLVAKESGVFVAVKGECSVTKEDGALVSTEDRTFVAREPETSVTKKGWGSVAKEESIPSFLELEASVAREDGASGTREDKSWASSGPLMGSEKRGKAWH